MADKKFVKGLFKDTGHIDQPQASWRYALNTIMQDKDGSISNEGGTWPDGHLPFVDGAEHYVVVGSIPVDDDRVILFLKDQRTTVAHARSMIAIWEGEEKNTPGYTDGIKILFSDNSLYLAGRRTLDFNVNSRIEGTYKIDSRQDLVIYWTDDLNAPRAFNVSRQERQIDINFLNTFTVYGIAPSHDDHIDLLNLFPNSGPVPHIDFFTIYTGTDGDQQSVTHGGGLLTGVYYLALAYTDVDFVSTNFLTVSNPVSIVQEYDHTRPTFRKDGAKDGSQTSKAINWKISNLNTDYKYLKPVVIRKMGDAIDAFRLSDVDVSIAAVEGVVFSGIEGFTKSSISDVIIDTVSYETAKTVNQLDGILYVGNLTGTKDLGYQKYANNIKLQAVRESLAPFDEFWATTDNLETGFLNSAIDAGNYVDDSQSYRFATNIFKHKGYMRDEVYAIYIAFIMKDGSMSYAYHIPGRETLSATDETQKMVDGAVTHVQSLGELNKEYAKRFHFFDYSTVAGALNMNYWQNATEFYPNTDNYEVWDENGFVSTIQGDNVRHHHFPSNENNNYQSITADNTTTEVSTGTSGVLTPLNGTIVLRQMNDGDKYYGDGEWRPRRFNNLFTAGTSFPTAVANTMLNTTSGTGGNSCTGGYQHNGRTEFVAVQPCTVTTHYFTLEERACSISGASKTETRIRTNSSLTPETGSGAAPHTGTMHYDSCEDWSQGCGDSNANRTTNDSSVIQLLPGERIWIESKCVTGDRVRPGKTSDGVGCTHIDDLFNDFRNASEVTGTSSGSQATHGSMVSFKVESGPANLNPDDFLDAKLSHNVRKLGFKLKDVKIPKSIADKVQGFRVYYAKRDHVNKTILGQSMLNPMFPDQQILGRCSEVVGSGADGVQNMAQLYSLAEIFWSKDPWGRDLGDYPTYNIYDNLDPNQVVNGYKGFAFHDFTLLRTKNSIAAATHIKTPYTVRNLVWNGPGLEQERKMLSMVSNASSTTTAATINEYWGWDLAGDPQNCYHREIAGAIFMGGGYNNTQHGSGNYQYPRLLGQKAKMYLNGDSIFKGESLGFGGKIFNEYGESTLVFSLASSHELPALQVRQDNNGDSDELTHWGVHNPLTAAILLNEEYDWGTYGNAAHSHRSNQYLGNLCAFKTDVYKSIDSQKLVWTGFEVLGDDLKNYVFDDTTGNSTYGGATYDTQTTHPEHIYGGDTFICRYGFVSSLTPNNESEESRPQKAIYYHIVETQDNINFRHFESDTSLYFPGTPAKTLLKYAGSMFNEGEMYDFTKDSNIMYNDNYSEVNDLRTAFPLPLREVKQTDFPTRTHRSAKADTTGLIDNWRMFLANNFKDLPKNRGDLWKLSTFNNLLYFHMEDSLFAAKGKQSMSMKDGSEAFVGSGDIFQQEPDELIQTKSGYGGTQSQWAALTTRNGYFFVDRDARKVFLMQDKITEISKIGLEGWFQENLKYQLEDYGLVDVSDNPLTGFGLHSAWDSKYKRIILTKREFIPTVQFQNYYDAGNIKFEYGVFWIKPYPNAGWTELEYTNTSYFEPGGWTISYLPELNIWVSWHSYVPYLYFNTSTNFYSITDKYLAYVDGTISSNGVAAFGGLPTSRGNATIWKHNERYKGLLYKDQLLSTTSRDPFEFEYVENAVSSVSKVFYNISYTLQCYKYNTTNETHDLNILNHGFTNYFIYNTHQAYTVPTTTTTSGLEYLINVRKIASEWKINGFRDLAILATQAAAGGYYMSAGVNVIGGTNVGTLTTRQDEKIININYLGGHYTENLNTNYINFNKPWQQQKKFIDKWVGIRLIYDNIENNLLNLYSTEVGSRKYYR